MTGTWEKALIRLREAARRHGDAMAELRESEKELVAASLALDKIEDDQLPTYKEIHGIMRMNERNAAES
jgi:hypothetical protein